MIAYKGCYLTFEFSVKSRKSQSNLGFNLVGGSVGGNIR